MFIKNFRYAVTFFMFVRLIDEEARKSLLKIKNNYLKGKLDKED